MYPSITIHIPFVVIISRIVALIKSHPTQYRIRENKKKKQKKPIIYNPTQASLRISRFLPITITQTIPSLPPSTLTTITLAQARDRMVVASRPALVLAVGVRRLQVRASSAGRGFKMAGHRAALALASSMAATLVR